MQSSDILLQILFFALFIYSVVLHEIAHGYVAYRLGDWTAKLDGRLTLNPIPHIDAIGTILLPLVLRVLGSPVVFGWAKPVPVNYHNLRGGERSYMMVAIAGIVVNLTIALIGSVIVRILVVTSPGSLFLYLMYYLVSTNILLAVFNLIPIPPLDGSRLLRGVLPAEYKHVLDQIEPYGFVVLFLALWSLQGLMWQVVTVITGILTGVSV